MSTSRNTTLAGVVALAAVAAAPVTAQTEAADWLPWTGCWVEVGAQVGAPMTCVVPDDGGAAFLTVTDDGVTARDQVRSDGVERAVASGGCEGVQSAELSADGSRVYTRSRLTCDGGTERSTRGLMAVVEGGWIRVRALTVGEGSVSWVTRYRPAPARRVEAANVPELAALEEQSLAAETARMAASGAPSVDDIIEAHARTDAEAVRAWIAEQGAPLRLDADRLVRLADAGVDPEVIDVVVAVSYPERFNVARQPQQGDQQISEYDRYRSWDRYRYGTPLYDPFYYGYDRFYYGYRGYSPYGLGYYGYRSPTVVIVHPNRPDGEARGGGRAVKGGGYTRPASSSGSGRVAVPRGSSSSGGAIRSSGSSGSSSSGSSGSKGKAKPRGGG